MRHSASMSQYDIYKQCCWHLNNKWNISVDVISGQLNSYQRHMMHFINVPSWQFREISQWPLGTDAIWETSHKQSLSSFSISSKSYADNALLWKVMIRSGHKFAQVIAAQLLQPVQIVTWYDNQNQNWNNKNLYNILVINYCEMIQKHINYTYWIRQKENINKDT